MAISILAGNTRIERATEGSLHVDPQLTAFEAAMKLASETREVVQKICIAIDHKHNPTSFLDAQKTFTRRERKSMRLAYLDPIIREKYESVLMTYDIHPEDIHLIFEKHLFDDVRQHKNNSHLFRLIGNSCEADSPKVSCQGVTAAIINRLGKDLQEGDTVHTFWEQRAVWTDPLTIQQGTVFARDFLDVKAQVYETFFRSKGAEIRRTTKEYFTNEETGKTEVI